MSIAFAITSICVALAWSFFPVGAADLPETVTVARGGQMLELRLDRLVEEGELVSRFGWRRHPMGGGGVHHDGIDIRAPRGAPVHAAAAGTVIEIARGPDFGRFVRIRHSDRLDTIYAHLSSVPRTLKMGHDVTPDDVIGFVGSTGRSTGPHLHFEVRRDGHPLDPLTGEPRRPAQKKAQKKPRAGGA